MALDVPGELLDDAFTPFGGVDLLRDVLTDAPVEVDELGVDRRHRPSAGLPDHLEHFGKRRIIAGSVSSPRFGDSAGRGWLCRGHPTASVPASTAPRSSFSDHAGIVGLTLSKRDFRRRTAEGHAPWWD
jgi:hypothetical protein